MKPFVCAGPPCGLPLLLVLVCCPLLGLVQSAGGSKAGDNEHPHLGDADPERCMRHHYVETIAHPIYKCNSKVRTRRVVCYRSICSKGGIQEPPPPEKRS